MSTSTSIGRGRRPTPVLQGGSSSSRGSRINAPAGFRIDAPIGSSIDAPTDSNDPTQAASDSEEIAPVTGKVVLYLSKYTGIFDPSLKVRASTTDVFQSMQDPDGVNWSAIPPYMKNLYWGEFMNYYSWDEKVSTSMVKKLWLKIASDSYQDFVSRIKRMYYGEEKQCKKIQLQEGVLERWVAYWELPNVKAKSEQARKNRFSEPAGPGTGYSIHHGGSRCAELYTQIVAKEKNCDLSECLIDTHMHLHYKDEKWTDRKAQRVMEEVERRLEALPQPFTRKK